MSEACWDGSWSFRPGARLRVWIFLIFFLSLSNLLLRQYNFWLPFPKLWICHHILISKHEYSWRSVSRIPILSLGKKNCLIYPHTIKKKLRKHHNKYILQHLQKFVWKSLNLIADGFVLWYHSHEDSFLCLYLHVVLQHISFYLFILFLVCFWNESIMLKKKMCAIQFMQLHYSVKAVNTYMPFNTSLLLMCMVVNENCTLIVLQ